MPGRKRMSGYFETADVALADIPQIKEHNIKHLRVEQLAVAKGMYDQVISICRLCHHLTGNGVGRTKRGFTETKSGPQ